MGLGKKKKKKVPIVSISEVISQPPFQPLILFHDITTQGHKVVDTKNRIITPVLVIVPLRTDVRINCIQPHSDTFPCLKSLIGPLKKTFWNTEWTFKKKKKIGNPGFL